MDEVCLNGIAVSCVIGDLPEERTHEQTLKVDAALSVDLTRAAASDDLADTVDYAALSQAVRAALRAAKCRLVERAAAVVCETCLADPRVAAVSVTVTKTGCVPDLASASVRMTRSRVR